MLTKLIHILNNKICNLFVKNYKKYMSEGGINILSSDINNDNVIITTDKLSREEYSYVLSFIHNGDILHGSNVYNIYINKDELSKEVELVDS